MKVVDVNAKGGTPPVHPDHELSPEEEVRYSELFGKLDVDGDGRINVDDLQEGLVRMGVHMVPNHAEKFMSKSDQNKDGHLDFSEFVRYVTEHEKQLHIVFKSVDHNQDGAIDVDEILLSLKKLGVSVSKEEADRLLKSMDKDGTLKVDWNEWRNYLLLHPSSDLRDIYAYWRHATFLDIGEDVMVPDEFTEQERQTGMWWRILAAGGAAGAVSRTVTAPLDRLKVILQVIGSKKPNIGILDGFKHMYREGGFKSFWRGNGINVIKIAPESAIKFLAYERIKRLLHTEGTELKVYERFVAGALAGVVAQTTIYPMELKCCGVDNYTDWMGYNMSTPDMVPESCCMEPGTADCNKVGSATFAIYTTPCYNALKDLLITNIGIIAGVAIGIAVIEIFGIAFGCCLMRKIKNEYETV